MATKTAITNGIVITMNPEREILYDGTIVIEDDRIYAILPSEDWSKSDEKEVINAQGMVVIPGLINSHMHSRPARALGDGLTSPEWHERYAQKFSALMDEESTYFGALNVFAENVKGGVTCLMNMPPSVKGSDKAAWEIGVRAILLPHGGSVPRSADANESLEQSLANVQEAGDQKGKRVKIWFGFGHPHECDRQYMAKIHEYASKYNTGICGHVAIHDLELKETAKIFGTSQIVEYFQEMNFLSDDMVLVHGTYLSPPAIEFMVDAGVSLIHCPAGPFKSGKPPIDINQMMEAGLKLGIATDGPLSLYHLDMFEVMRLNCYLHRMAEGNPDAMSPLKSLELATIDNAKALGMEEEIGSLEVGKKADITMVNFQSTHLAPLTTGADSNLIPLLVYCCNAADADTVIVDGQIIMRNRKLILVDENEIITQVTNFANHALNKIS